MRLTRQTNYAVRILMFCASNPGLSRIAQIAEFYAISEPFLFKILQAMTKAGLIDTVRGRSGGIRLSRPAEEIRLGHVVRLIEENFDLVECFEAGETQCPLIASCGMSEALKEALDAFFAVLDRYSIADLTDKQRNIGILARLELLKMEPLATH
ncbi:MAG: iron-responsive transcriptional regulator RirA [Rhizobiaceae bacterium]|nr:iron-responsive transcriptional regulator RirA [Rhizobiaceae bacterium]